jgi:hypothetical protein
LRLADTTYMGMGTVSPREYQREQTRKEREDQGQGFVGRNRFRIGLAGLAAVAVAVGLFVLLNTHPASLNPTLSPPSSAAIASESSTCKSDIALLTVVIERNQVQGAFAGAVGPLPATKQAQRLDEAVDGACPASVATWVDGKIYLAWLSGGRIYPEYAGGTKGIPPISR